MKIAINVCYGGFDIPRRIREQLPHDFNEFDLNHRTNDKLISLIESEGGVVKDDFSEVVITEIPDEATDWMINDYDGLERIIYVLDGKLHGA